MFTQSNASIYISVEVLLKFQHFFINKILIFQLIVVLSTIMPDAHVTYKRKRISNLKFIMFIKFNSLFFSYQCLLFQRT